MEKIFTLLREEDGSAEMLQVVILLGLAALIVVFIITTSIVLESWGKDRVDVILQEDRVPEKSDGDFEPPDWIDPNHH